MRWEWRRWLAPAAMLPAIAHRRVRGVAVLAGIAAIVVLALYFGAGSAIFPPRPTMRSTTAPPSDPAQRAAYYRDAANSGDSDAALQLAILYAKGEGVPQDYATAATWFQTAADKGVARAQYDLGVLYERGRGVPVDFAVAANWYQKAAEAHFPLAEYNLAVAYTKGQGIRQDLNEAAQWYRRAAGHGVVQAMINLAVLYERGEGVTASPVDAYAWYLAAGRRGNQPSARRAEELFAVLTHVDQVRAQALSADVAASIHDPQPEPASGADPAAKSGIDAGIEPSPAAKPGGGS
jgi:TPR repeat protein